MDDSQLSFFEIELQTQCKFVGIGAELVNDQLASTHPEHTTIVWFALQGILVSAANASKLLWGGKKAAERAFRKPLREALNVEDISPLCNRDVRNHFEHFDERLEKWLQRPSPHNFFHRNIGPPDGFVVWGEPPQDAFGRFDPVTGIVTFAATSVPLNPIIKETNRIRQLIEQRRSRQ